MTQLVKKTRSNPFFEIQDMGRSLFDEVFNDFFGPEVSEKFRLGFDKYQYPKADIINEKDRILFEVDIHGLSKEDVSVEIEPSEQRKVSYLHIKGKSKTRPGDDGGRDYIAREIKRSSWHRSWTLSEEKYNLDKVEVDVKDGLLSISIPKVVEDKEERKVRKLL